jgi:undecaprenyl-diphosphatase
MEGPRLLMTTALHVGTLGSILAVYWKDVLELVRGPLGMIAPRRWGRAEGGAASEKDRKGLLTLIAVVEAALITAPIGLLLESRVEPLSRNMFCVGGFFLITGLLLLGTRFVKPGARDVGYLLALPVGLAQGLAVFPGISRSGATIVVALVLGARREEAVRFSFLAALPVLAGAMVLEGGLELAELAARWHVYLTGALVSFLVGWASLRILIRLTERRKLYWFTPYLLLLGLALMLS